MSQSDLDTVIMKITVTINTNTNGAELVKKIKSTFKFIITIDTIRKSYCYIDLKNKSGSVSSSETENNNIKTDCTITMNQSDFIDLFNGNLTPQKAFMQGIMRIKGDIIIVQKLSHLINKVKNTTVSNLKNLFELN